MSRTPRHSALLPLLGAVASAELGVRLLRPRTRPLRPLPVDLSNYFSEEELARGRRFARPQLALGLVRSVVDAAALVALVRRPPTRWLGAWGSRPAGGAAAAAVMASAITLPGVPLAALGRRRSLEAGLATQSWAGWAGDLVKATAIQSAFAGGAGAGAIWMMRRYPRGWWAPAAGVSVLLGGALGALAPVVLDPLFNDFKRLPEGQTREDVLALADDAGVQVGEVYEVDASRRTTAANAYVTGLGPTKRVVLFDTLLDRYDRDQVRAVVAHELSHVRGRDVWRSVAFAALTAPLGALAAQRLSWRLSPARADAAALPAVALAAGIVSVPTGLLANRLSRALERRADTFALRLSDAPHSFVNFERQINLQNLADIDPPRLLTGILATHPSTRERIGAALAYERERSELGGSVGHGGGVEATAVAVDD